MRWRRGVEDVGEDLLSEFPGLTLGEAIIGGEGVNTPFPARIGERYTVYKAESLPAIDEWRKAWRKNNDVEVNGMADADQDEGVEDREQRL